MADIRVERANREEALVKHQKPRLMVSDPRARAQAVVDAETRRQRNAREMLDTTRGLGGLSVWGITVVCYWCNRGVTYKSGPAHNPLRATREHLLPKSLGGGTRGNIVVACQSCNTRRSSYVDWVPWHKITPETVTSLPGTQVGHFLSIGILTVVLRKEA